MPIVLALALLSAVEASPDGASITLSFNAPVTFIQTTATAPPRLILDVAGAAAAPGVAGPAEAAGLTFGRAEVSGSLRLILPIVPGGTAAARPAARNAIVIDISSPPALVEATRVNAPPQAPPAGGGAAGAAAGGEYVIGAEDLLEINVFELPELKTTARVLADGTVSLPLLGVVQAGGLSKTGFEARLRELLASRFVQDPQVTVTVTEHRSRLVSVIGAVTKPGTYEMIGPRTVLQMLSEAGGLTKEAGSEIIILRRSESGGAVRLALDLEDLVIHGDPDLNLPLAPGDVVNIPIDRPIYVFVDGAVRNPGQVEGKSSRPITLLQAVARTGGLTERANLRGVHIIRKGPGGAQKRIPVNLRDIRKGKSDDIVLEDGDVIVVPETFF